MIWNFFFTLTAVRSLNDLSFFPSISSLRLERCSRLLKRDYMMPAILLSTKPSKFIQRLAKVVGDHRTIGIATVIIITIALVANRNLWYANRQTAFPHLFIKYQLL